MIFPRSGFACIKQSARSAYPSFLDKPAARPRRLVPLRERQGCSLQKHAVSCATRSRGCCNARAGVASTLPTDDRCEARTLNPHALIFMLTMWIWSCIAHASDLRRSAGACLTSGETLGATSATDVLVTHTKSRDDLDRSELSRSSFSLQMCLPLVARHARHESGRKYIGHIV